jgi:hypothetical protein
MHVAESALAERADQLRATSAIPRHLVLSCTPPGPQGVGGIILRDLFAMLPPGCLAGYFLVAQPAKGKLPSELAAVPTRFTHVKHETAPQSRLGRAGRALAAVRNAAAFRSHVQALVADATAFGRQQEVAAVWAVLDAPTSIAMAEPVARALGVPLLSLVWDDAAHLAASLALDSVAAANMMQRKAQALKASKRCAVIGETMKRHYESHYGTGGVVLRHGMARNALHPVRVHDNGEAVFSLGFAGTMNAPCAFNALLDALESCGWCIAGRQIELRLVGPRFDMRSNKPALFRSYGWRSVEETIGILAGADAAYLPQPFSADRRNMAELSFPTKLTTYLAAGRPIVLHAPEYASLPQYHAQQPLGVHCGAADPQAIVAALHQLITDSSVYANAARHARAAYERDFTRDRFANSFAEFLGLDSASLVKVGA